MTELISFIRQRFDRRSVQYLRNPITHLVGHSELSALKTMLPPLKQSAENLALDFGCGTGRVTAMLLEAGFKVTGFDISSGMLEQACAAMGENPNVIFTSDSTALLDQWPSIVK